MSCLRLLPNIPRLTKRWTSRLHSQPIQNLDSTSEQDTATTFDEDLGLRNFDKLVKLGIIPFGPTKAVQLTDATFPFEFHIVPHWTKKPTTVTSALSLPSQQKPETFGPGSDIAKSHSSQLIAQITPSHFLALNAFPAFRPQYMLLCNDSYRSQNEPLDQEDFAAALTFLRQARSEWFVLFNCTKEAGCSRLHKHLQIFGKPEGMYDGARGFWFFPDVPGDEVKVPYRYFLHYFTSPSWMQWSEEIYSTYLSLLEKCRIALATNGSDYETNESDNGEKDFGEKLCPHNMILTKQWMILIPRRSNDFHGVTANGMGMLGMPLIGSEEVLERWKHLGPARCLGELGVAAF